MSTPAKLSDGEQPNSAADPLKTPMETEPPALRETLADSPLASKLETVAERAIEKLEEIMKIPLDPENLQYGAVLRAQAAVANTALITQVRVDENKLRARAPDTLSRLLKRMGGGEAKMALERSATERASGNRNCTGRS